MWAIQELLEPRREIWREVFQRFEQRPKELLYAWTGHAALLGRTGNVPEAYEEPMSGVNYDYTLNGSMDIAVMSLAGGEPRLVAGGPNDEAMPGRRMVLGWRSCLTMIPAYVG